MKISVIIPTLNEAENIKRLLVHLYKYGGKDLHEIIVSDGGSDDNTIKAASSIGATIVCSEIRGRAFQMNAGAKVATGDILYFVHADAIPPVEFVAEIQNAVSQNKKAGCFRFRYDSDRKLLAINSYFTRFNGVLSGGGDQSLYIKKNLFDELEGFDKSHIIMEDYELVNRIRKRGIKFHVIPKAIIVSARKYNNYSYLRVKFSNLLVFSLYKMGVKPEKLSGLYKKLINPYRYKKEIVSGDKTEMIVNTKEKTITSGVPHQEIPSLFNLIYGEK